MPENKIRQSLLKHSYKLYTETGGKGFFLFEEWEDEQRLDVKEILPCVGSLLADDILHSAGPGMVVMSPEGALWMEKAEQASIIQIEENKHIRAVILDTLANMCEESTFSTGADAQILYEKTGLSAESFGGGYNILELEGFAKQHGFGQVIITPDGLEYIKTRKAHVQRTEKFQGLQAGKIITPQARGHELESLLTDVIKNEGWKVEQNVRTPGEEHDLIMYRHTEYYFVQCKWEKKRVQPSYLTILQGRVSRRPGARGVFISMSGYTEEAIKDSIEVLQSNTILLYGPQDVEGIMIGQTKFTSLLEDKFHAAMIHRSIILDGKQYKR